MVKLGKQPVTKKNGGWLAKDFRGIETSYLLEV